jgi:hypothetical protein
MRVQSVGFYLPSIVSIVFDCVSPDTNTIMAQADSLLSDLAVTEMATAVANIQQTISTMKENALEDAAAQLGKPQSGDHG